MGAKRVHSGHLVLHHLYVAMRAPTAQSELRREAHSLQQGHEIGGCLFQRTVMRLDIAQQIIATSSSVLEVVLREFGRVRSLRMVSQSSALAPLHSDFRPSQQPRFQEYQVWAEQRAGLSVLGRGTQCCSSLPHSLLGNRSLRRTYFLSI